MTALLHNPILAEFLTQRRGSKLILIISMVVVYAIVSLIFAMFPRQRKIICIVLLTSGIVLLAGSALYGANADAESHKQWDDLMIITLITGMVTAIVGYALFKKIQSDT